MTRHAWHWENVFVWDLSERGVQNKYKYIIWICTDDAPLEKCAVEMWCFKTDVFFPFIFMWSEVRPLQIYSAYI